VRKWGSRSAAVRAGLHKKLKIIVDRILEEVADISLISGHRGEEEQNDLFRSGKSTLEYPQSKHNTYPSMAVDLQPYPYPKRDEKLWGALGYIAGHAMRIARDEGVTLRWGGDWNRNGDLTDQRFDDLFHLEIIACESANFLQPSAEHSSSVGQLPTTPSPRPSTESTTESTPDSS
jgi:hypothetical protein